MKAHIAIFASGSGTNAEQIIKYFQNHPTIAVSVVMSNNPKAGVLDRAARMNVHSEVFTREQFQDSQVMIKMLEKFQVTHIVLAGFLWMMPEYLVKNFHDKIINIHPALLPKYGGKGMYGLKVHEAVKAAKDKESGITIHLVNEYYDEGRILFQARCEVKETFTAEEIQNCVHALEYEHYPKVIESWIGNTNLSKL